MTFDPELLPAFAIPMKGFFSVDAPLFSIETRQFDLNRPDSAIDKEQGLSDHGCFDKPRVGGFHFPYAIPRLSQA